MCSETKVVRKVELTENLFVFSPHSFYVRIMLYGKGGNYSTCLCGIL